MAAIEPWVDTGKNTGLLDVSCIHLVFTLPEELGPLVNPQHALGSVFLGLSVLE